MSQHATPVDVTDGVNAVNVGTHIIVYGDTATLCCHAYGFKAKSAGVGFTTCRHEYDVGNGLPSLALTLVINFKKSVGRGDTAYPGLHYELYTALLHSLAHTPRNVLIVWGKALFHVFNDGYLAPETPEHGSELETYHAGANDTQTTWKGA